VSAAVTHLVVQRDPHTNTVLHTWAATSKFGGWVKCGELAREGKRHLSVEPVPAADAWRWVDWAEGVES